MIDEIMIPVEDRPQEENPEGLARIMSIAEMEQERDRLYRDYIKVIGTPEEKRLLKAIDLMDEILDAQEQREESAEDTNKATNWDEWDLDYRIDMMREERMAYER